MYTDDELHRKIEREAQREQRELEVERLSRETRNTDNLERIASALELIAVTIAEFKDTQQDFLAIENQRDMIELYKPTERK
jgi:hypothetical protein